jgi:hypothetical protein
LVRPWSLVPLCAPLSACSTRDCKHQRAFFVSCQPLNELLPMCPVRTEKGWFLSWVRTGNPPVNRAIQPGRATSPPQFTPLEIAVIRSRVWRESWAVGSGSRTKHGLRAFGMPSSSAAMRRCANNPPDHKRDTNTNADSDENLLGNAHSVRLWWQANNSAIGR